MLHVRQGVSGASFDLTMPGVPGSGDVDVAPFAGPVLMRAGGYSGHSPLLEDFQGRTPLERRMRSADVVLNSVLLRQQPGFLHRGEQFHVQELVPESAIE